MKTGRQLTKRERTLLYVLAILIILSAGWYFLVAPQLELYNTQKIDVDALKSEYISVKNDNNYTTLNKNYQEAQKKYQEFVKHFANSMNSEDVDRALTLLASNSGFTPVSLEIGDTTSISVAPYGTTVSKDNKNTSSYPSVSAISITQVVEGSTSNLTRLIDALNQETALEITAMSYSTTKGNDKAENQQITLSYIIYIIPR